MSKKFFCFVVNVYLREFCFVRIVYLRDYPNPYLYTRTGPIGDIGLLLFAVLKRYPVPPPILPNFLLLFSLFACRVWWWVWVLVRIGSRFNYSDNAYLGIS